jgi:H/ACA ribonucleoprotein complex subunit 2
MSDDEADGKATPKFVSPIATPLAGKKLTKRLQKVVKKAAGAKVLKRGVKEVVKALRKGEKGLCIIAADIFPVDVISHIPVFCEEQGVRYVYVKSKAELGAAASTKRPTSVVLVAPGKKAFDAQDKLDECITEVISITPSY